MDSRRRQRRTAVLSACAGHTIEWYDFGVYAFVASNIARQIFPSGDEFASLLATFAAFGVGFLARPLGGILLGRFGDRYGSRRALVLSFSLMGVATLGLGLVPSHAAIGWLAPALVVACRLLQGISAGGEYAASASYLVAWAPEGRRGLFGSFQQMGSAAGALLGSAIGLGLSAVLEAQQMMEWGWRVPFLLGSVMILAGLYLRSHAAEAPEFDVTATQDRTEAGRGNASRALQLAAFAGAWAVPFYLILFYMPTFTQKVLHFPQRDALAISTVGLVFYVACIPFCGRLADAWGRRKPILLGALACAVLAFVLFPRMVDAPGFGFVLAAQLALNLALALVSGPAPATIVEMFPPRRLAWMNGAYAIALAVFGGFTPWAVTWLVAATGSAASPMFLLAGAALALAAVVMLSRETAFAQPPLPGLQALPGAAVAQVD
jgi:MHS family proline/betaine transporter-like MFS transporter